MRTRINQNKEQIFCEWRHRWVRLTPEEWVRQQLLHRLVGEYGYPASLIAVEVPLEKISIVSRQSSNRQSLRADAVVYDSAMQPLVLIECKAETVPLTQKTLDQAVTYNRKLNVPYLLLYNGPQTVFVRLDKEKVEFYAAVPTYKEMTNGK